MTENILHTEKLTMQFGGVMAVYNLTIDVYKGEIVALIGPNGAGKTTAFNCITGVYEPTNGSVSFCGKTIVSNHPQGRMKKLYAGDRDITRSKVISPTPDKITKLGIARTFQNIRLFKSLTVFENVLVAKHMRAKQNIFSATFRLNWPEEKRARNAWSSWKNRGCFNTRMSWPAAFHTGCSGALKSRGPLRPNQSFFCWMSRQPV